MIDKKLHITVAGFYAIFALIVSLISSVIIGISTGIVILIWFLILFIFVIIHSGYIAWVIFKQSEDILIDVEDQSQHMRNEVGHINSALQSFTDVIDTLISQQSNIEKKIEDINKPLFTKEPEPHQTQEDNFSHKPFSSEDNSRSQLKEKELKQNIQQNIESWESVSLEEQITPPPIQYTPPQTKVVAEQKLPSFLSDGAPPPIPQTPSAQPTPPPQEEEFRTATTQVNSSSPKILENEEFADITNMVKAEDAVATPSPNNEEFLPTAPVTELNKSGSKKETSLEEAFLNNIENIQEKANNIEKSSKNISHNNSSILTKADFSSEIHKKKNISVPPLQELITKDTPPLQNELSQRLTPSTSSTLPSLDKLLIKNNLPIPSPANSSKEMPAPLKDKPLRKTSSPQESTSHTNNDSPSENIEDAFIALQEELKNTPSPSTAPPPTHIFKKQNQSQNSDIIKFSSTPLPNPANTLEEAIEKNYFNVAFKPIVDTLHHKTALYEASHYLQDNNNTCYEDSAYISDAQQNGMDILIDRMLITRSVMILKSDHAMFTKKSLIIKISLKALTDDNFHHELIEILKEKTNLGRKIIFSFAHNQFALMTKIRAETLKELTHYGISYGVHQIEKNLPALQNFIDIGIQYINIPLEHIEKGVTVDHKLYHNQDFKQLCNQFGIIILINSINDENTLLSAMQIGSDLLMGTYFGDAHALR